MAPKLRTSVDTTCGSSAARLMEARYAVRIVERPEGSPGRERKCQVYRCLSCGRSFDELEAGEGPEPEKNGEPSYD